MPAAEVDLLAVGEAMIDIRSSADAGTPAHGRIRLRAGGTPVNAARCAVSLGATAAVVARVGRDSAAAMIRAELRALGVHADLAADDHDATGVWIQLPAGIVADRGANAHLVPGDLAAAPQHRALLVSGYTFRDRADAAGRAALESSGARWRAVDAGGAKAAALALPANVIFGTAGELGSADDADALALRLAERFEIAVVKLGRDGAVAASAGTVSRHAAALEPAVDTAGAGDAFDAAFLIGLVRGLPIAGALALASDAAAAAIEAVS